MCIFNLKFEQAPPISKRALSHCDEFVDDAHQSKQTSVPLLMFVLIFIWIPELLYIIYLILIFFIPQFRNPNENNKKINKKNILVRSLFSLVFPDAAPS